MAIKIVSAIAAFSASMMLVSVCRCQRPSFAGSRPIGYPELSTAAAGLADRFGEANGTTERLPIEALGDRDLVNRLSKLPLDKQPFWLINWQVLEEHRKNPQSYPQRPNSFVSSNNMNFDQFVETSSQESTANRFGSVESSGSSNSSVLTGVSEKVNSSVTGNFINGNIGNATVPSGSLGAMNALIFNSTSAASAVLNTSRNSTQDDKDIKGKQKKNDYIY